MTSSRIQFSSLGGRLILLATVTSGLAATAIASSLIVRSIDEMRSQALDSLTVQADLLGQSNAAAIAFEDIDAALTALTEIERIPGVIGAALFDDEGNRIAAYPDPRVVSWTIPERPGSGHTFDDGALHLYRKVIVDDDIVGHIYMLYDMTTLSAEIRREALSAAGLSLVAWFAALGLAYWFQKTLTRPLVKLGATMRQVSQDRDYSIRAIKKTDDEIGQLADGFNDMLAQIESRDLELKEISHRLESEVANRTADLRQALISAQSTAEALSGSECKTRAIVNGAADGILVFDAAGRISTLNPAAEDIFQRSLSEDVEINIEELFPPKVWQDGLRTLFCGTAPKEDFATRGRRADGNEFPMEVSVRLTSVAGHKQHTAMVRDITSRVEAAKQREVFHQQLVEASRKAGMAEVATGVLHNVGNILNTLNVGLSMLRKHLRETKIGSLQKISGLLQEHRDDLPGFVASERGRVLPEFLAKVTEAFESDREQLEAEVAELVKSLTHINEVVTAQQTLAKPGSVWQDVSPESLIEEALRFDGPAIERSGIHIETTTAGIERLLVDRSNVVQILINLTKNAYHAVRDTDGDTGTILIGVTKDDESDAPTVRFTVSDSGHGIDAEHLVKIFHYGFTTKADGHGFGLHHCANLATQMGGRLSATSDGVGHGATFTLEVPAGGHIADSESAATSLAVG